MSTSALLPVLNAAQARRAVPRPAPTTSLEVALVSMPWTSVYRPSLAIAILKQCVRSAGFVPSVHLLSMDFANQIGLPLYEQVSASGGVHADWFFAQHLFGRDGLRELENSWDDLRNTPFGGELRDIVRQDGADDESVDAQCRRLAEEDVPAFIDDCARRVDWSRYDVVGFTTTFAQTLASLALAKRIKDAHPKVQIVFGGANVDSEMGVEFVRGFPWVDYVVHGEAERSFPELLDAVASGARGASVPGVTGRLNGDVARAEDSVPLHDLNESPQPDYSDYLSALDRIGLKKRVDVRLYFETSRGCWWGAKHHCTFCGLNGTTMAFRKKTAERAYTEILDLARRYNCLTFSAADNILATEYYSQLLPRLAEQDIDLNMFFEVKSNLTREQLKLFRDAGIKEIQPGIESLNSRLLQLMRKGVTAIQNLQLLKWCHELGIEPHWNYLYGFPGETPDDYAFVPDLFCALGHLPPPTAVTPVVFERFSPYFFDREKFGLRLQPWSVYRSIYPEQRVAIERIAYYFDGCWEGQVGNPKEYAAPVESAYRVWAEGWRSGTTFCYFDKGPGFVRIHDNRPASVNAPHNERTVTLRDRTADIYLFCDTNRPVAAIEEMLRRQEHGAPVTQTQLREWLDSLVSQRLMFREGERYLALAVRKKPLRRRVGTPSPA